MTDMITNQRSQKRTPFSTVVVLTLLVGAGLAVAQGDNDEKPTSKPSSKAKSTPSVQEVLESLSASYADVKTMRAGFVQEVRTILTFEPLVSKGTFNFRREPTCIVFAIEEPKRAIVRIGDKSYQVYRPDRKEAERYLLEGNDLSGAIGKVFSPKAGELEENFEVETKIVKGEITLSLSPRKKSISRFITSLELRLDERTFDIRRISYKNSEDDEITISIESLERNPDLDDKLFSDELPDGTRVSVHQVKKTPARKAER